MEFGSFIVSYIAGIIIIIIAAFLKALLISIILERDALL